ncbi:MAG TPA: S1 RNA-binding domain-containing protein [Candidatus Parcubacteria bacterium]|nr:S1 RNA-binding domain-containing protein [Candidatus Parcubacteria bacterium]
MHVLIFYHKFTSNSMGVAKKKALLYNLGYMENTLKTKNQNDLPRPLRSDEIIKGKVIGTGRSSVYVDLGAFGTGVIYGREFYDSKEELKNIKIGDNIFTKILDLENEEGFVELSLRQAGKELNWTELSKKKEKGEVITVKILGANKGGLLAEIQGIRGFLPVSQLSFENYPRVKEGEVSKILEELQKFIGKNMEVKVFDINPKEEKLILSEKAALSSKIKEILKKYKVEDVVDGEITGIVDFGAFIKFGKETLEGLIHISELDWQLIDNPSEIVKVGQKVKAKIINISDDRVFLSLKALKKDPWENIEKKHKKGDLVKGKVTKFNPFGAFVEISSKIQGLCHISEFSTKTKMEEVLKVGEKYDFKIIQIDPKQHRMILTLVKK